MCPILTQMKFRAVLRRCQENLQGKVWYLCVQNDFFSKSALLEMHSNVIEELKNNLLGTKYKIISFFCIVIIAAI